MTPRSLSRQRSRSFETSKNYLEQDGYTFTGNRPEEKDRQLLVQFDNVIAELRNMKPVHQAIIKDITDKMGNGMADFARKAAFGDSGVKTVEEYNLYCWYVAGVVGEGRAANDS
jgi:farnesyl-diphosphate farnesyltransferase